jgi:hypothetical protein
MGPLPPNKHLNAAKGSGAANLERCEAAQATYNNSKQSLQIRMQL